VESILDSRKRNGEIEHLIKWAGYSESENSWARVEFERLRLSSGPLPAFLCD
jgi:hypothetical protein